MAFSNWPSSPDQNDLSATQGNRAVAAGVAREILGPETSAEEIVLLSAWIIHGAVINVRYPRPEDPVSPDAMTVRYPNGSDLSA